LRVIREKLAKTLSNIYTGMEDITSSPPFSDVAKSAIILMGISTIDSGIIRREGG
jgi:hypothetical protein